MTKTLLSVILALIFTLLPARAENWTTSDGKTYKGVTVVKVEADAVTILDSDGGALVPLDKLSPDLQKRFNYDPAKAKTAADARAKADAETARVIEGERAQIAAKKEAEAHEQAVAATAQPASGHIVQVLPDGVLSTVRAKGIADQPCFIACDSNGLVDGLWWRGKIIPAGTYTYTDTTGATATVLKFEGDMAQAVKVPQINPVPPPAAGLTGVGL